MDVKKRLYEKMSNEYDKYIEGLKQLPAEEIIRHSKESLYKEDILSCVDHAFIPEHNIRTLLTMKHPLDVLYKRLENSDAVSDAYIEFITDNVTDVARSLSREIRDKNDSR